jgi:VIT1/CCC1 family predicted Fe2+/Mn2+ transporter
LAFWSEFASAFAAQVHSLCASVTAVYLSFFVFGRVLTRLDTRNPQRIGYMRQ